MMDNFTYFPVSKGKTLPLRGLTLPELIRKKAGKFDKKLLLKFHKKRVSYTEFNNKTEKMAGALQEMGIKKGDRVALMFKNCLELLESYFAVWKTGAWVIPINPTFTPRELEYLLRDSEAKMIISEKEQLQKIETVKEKVATLQSVIIDTEDSIPGITSYNELQRESFNLRHVSISSDDVCQIMYTSGTEGEPKGVMTTHGGYTDNALIRSTILELSKDDITLIPLPMFHMFGMATFLNFITVGGTVILMERFQTDEVLYSLEKDKITFFSGVPTMYDYLINHPKIDQIDLSSLRICIIAGGNVNYKVVEEFEKRFNCLFIESMGQTELSPLVMINPPYREKRRLGSCGLTVYNMETRLVDETDNDVPLGEVGELVVRSPCVMKGYYNRPEDTKQAFRNGWFHTGDLLRQDKDGYYYFVGRKKDMIITGGFNIYAKELEDVLINHPDIQEVAVIAVPDETKGQLAKAIIVLKEGTDLKEEDVKNYARKYLAPYKVPRIIKFVNELPHTPQGKIAKGILREKEGHK